MNRKEICKAHSLSNALGIAVLVTLFIAGGAGAVTDINVCTDIASPGEYRLIADIMDSIASKCINISSSDVILDGGGYAIDGVDADYSYGVFVSNAVIVLTNVTVRNLMVTDWQYGIYYQNSQNGYIENNSANSNQRIGIGLTESSNNILRGNEASNNRLGIELIDSNNSVLKWNRALNNNLGIDLLFSSGNDLTSNTADSNIYNGFSIWYSTNNDIAGNSASNNTNGIYFEGSDDNNLTGNNASNNSFGFSFLNSSDHNNVEGNAALDNDIGIMLNSSSRYHTFTRGNGLCSRCHVLHGVPILPPTYASRYNIFTRNLVKSSSQYGITFYRSGNNTVYNNIFNNTQNFGFSGTDSNVWNITKTAGTNIIGGRSIGGNVWTYPNGTGFSQTCGDIDNDGICDLSYPLENNNIDYLPLLFNNDMIPPITTIVLSGIPGNNSWYISSNVTVTLLPYDSGSGVGRSEISPDGITWDIYSAPFNITMLGETKVYYRSIDNAGNVENTKNQTVKIDWIRPNLNTNPVVRNATNSLGAVVDYIAQRNVTASDSHSGLLSLRCTPPPGLFPLGTTGVNCIAEDVAGNNRSVSFDITIRDGTPPETSILTVVDGNGIVILGNTQDTTVNFTFSGTDYVGTDIADNPLSFRCRRSEYTGAGWIRGSFAPCTSPWKYTNLTNNMTHSIEVYAIDNSGNRDLSPANFTWFINSQVQAVQNLITTIVNLDIPASERTSLSAPVRESVALLTDSSPANDIAVCGKMTSVINKVNAEEKTRRLTALQARLIRLPVKNIQDGLGC